MPKARYEDADVEPAFPRSPWECHFRIVSACSPNVTGKRESSSSCLVLLVVNSRWRVRDAPPHEAILK